MLEKYMKYKKKYILLKNAQQKGGNPDDNIYIYYGGSFSPITIAHLNMALYAINTILTLFSGDDKKKIIFYFVPTPTVYDKGSVSTKCISYENRKRLISLVIDEIKTIDNIKHHLTSNKLIIDICDFEQEEGFLRKSGSIGTYLFVDKFAKYNNIKNTKNIYLLYGQDNIEDMCKGPLIGTISPNKPPESKDDIPIDYTSNNAELLSYISSRGTKESIKYLSKYNEIPWKNTIHLLSSYKFLVFPRSSGKIDYDLLSNYIKNNIYTFEYTKHISPSHINLAYEYESTIDNINPLTKLSIKDNLLDIINSGKLNDTIIDIKSIIDFGSKDNIINLANTSSTKIRNLLVNKTPIEREKLRVNLKDLGVPESILNELIQSDLYFNEC